MLESDPITGVMVQYYYTCRRELWFYANRINMNYDNDDIEIGRQIQRESYDDNRKNILSTSQSGLGKQATWSVDATGPSSQ